MDKIFASSVSNTKVLLIISSSKNPVMHLAVYAKPFNIAHDTIVSNIKNR